jgi:hypothetical protein
MTSPNGDSFFDADGRTFAGADASLSLVDFVVFMSFFLNRCPSSCCLPLASPAVEPARRARERSQFPSESEKRDSGGVGGRGQRWRDFRARSHHRRGGGTVSGKQGCDGERLKGE